MTVVAYVIGDDVASDGGRVPDLRGPDGRWLRSSYPNLRDAFVAVPSASTPTPIAELDRLAEQIAAELGAWLRQIGFALHDLPNDEILFEVLDPDDLRCVLGVDAFG